MVNAISSPLHWTISIVTKTISKPKFECKSTWYYSLTVLKTVSFRISLSINAAACHVPSENHIQLIASTRAWFVAHVAFSFLDQLFPYKHFRIFWKPILGQGPIALFIGGFSFLFLYCYVNVINPLISVGSDSFGSAISLCMPWILKSMIISSQIAFRWIQQNAVDYKSTLVQVTAWYRQARRYSIRSTAPNKWLVLWRSICTYITFDGGLLIPRPLPTLPSLFENKHIEMACFMLIIKLGMDFYYEYVGNIYAIN